MQIIRELKRVMYDLGALGIILTLFMFRVNEWFPVAIQTIIYKGALISCGFLHAHITRKLAFSKVDWDTDDAGHKTFLVVCLYVIFIYAWAQGG